VQEVANALSTIASNAAESADQREILNDHAATVHLDEVRVRKGLSTQLDILASGDRLLQARQAEDDVDAEGLASRIKLLVAVGGGFNPKTDVALADESDHPASTGGIDQLRDGAARAKFIGDEVRHTDTYARGAVGSIENQHIIWHCCTWTFVPAERPVQRPDCFGTLWIVAMAITPGIEAFNPEYAESTRRTTASGEDGYAS